MARLIPGPRDAGQNTSSFGFWLFVTLVAFTLLSIPSRVPILGMLRPTVIMVLVLLVVVAKDWPRIKPKLLGSQSRVLFTMLGYILISLPFVEWPGSVVGRNLQVLINSMGFFFFTLIFVDDLRRLKIFLAVFFGSQTFRVLHPLILHITTGYWGDRTYLGDDFGFLPRLSGGPGDIINSNGLAFIVGMIAPFLYYWAIGQAKSRILFLWLPLAGALLYALTLTLSRSGTVALLIEAAAIVYMSKYRSVGIAVGVVTMMAAASTMSPEQLERYQSLYRSDVRGSDTAHGRMEGIEVDLEVWAERPVFGFGLGTSFEARFNLKNAHTMSHNLYTEVLIELGVFGIFILLAYMMACGKTVRATMKAVANSLKTGPPLDPLLQWLPRAIFVWMLMFLAFSFATYGLSTYAIYFMGGLAAVTQRLVYQSLGISEPEKQGRRRRGPQPARAVSSVSDVGKDSLANPATPARRTRRS